MNQIHGLSAKPIWWDGTKIRFDNVPKSSDGAPTQRDMELKSMEPQKKRNKEKTWVYLLMANLYNCNIGRSFSTLFIF